MCVLLKLLYAVQVSKVNFSTGVEGRGCVSARAYPVDAW